MNPDWDNISRQLLNQPAPNPSATYTVMVTDDEPSVRAFIALVLNGLNVDVLLASNGRDAQKILREREREHSRLDLLMADLMMPGMGGKELADWVWQKKPMQKVLFMSGFPELMARNRWELSPQMHFLQKPFSPLQLAARVSDVLRIASAVGQESPTPTPTPSIG